MNISKDKIDKLFSEKLDAFEVKPRAQAWEKLENKINNKNKKRTIGWYRFAIAASVALLVFVGGISYFNNSDPINSQPNLASNTTKATDNEAAIAGKEKVSSQENAKAYAKINHALIKRSLPNTDKKGRIYFYENGQAKPETAIEFIAKNEKTESENPIIKTINQEKIVGVLAENTPIKVEEIKGEQALKDEDLTIIFTVANFEKPTMNESNNDENLGKEKKSKYLTKLYKQLINAKNGDKVDWNEVGFKPSKILARAENKIKLTKNEINDSYQTSKNKTVF
jgi:hypothetical protein